MSSHSPVIKGLHPCFPSHPHPAAMSLKLNNCTVVFEDEKHALYQNAIQAVTAILRDPKDAEIARIQSWLVDRRFAMLFWLDTDKIMEGGPPPIFAYRRLFDKWGRLRPEHLSHGGLKGLGTWGEELNEGVMLYVGEVSLKQVRYGGVAEPYLLGELLKSSYLDRKDFACTDLYPELDLKRFELFSKHGFRRVGRTSIFAYSQDPLHRSRRLRIQDDIVSVYVHYLTCGLSVAKHERLDAGGLQHHLLKAHPIHAVLSNVANYTDDKLDKTIRALCHFQPSRAHDQDDEGQTPIYYAVKVGSLQGVRTLLSLGAAADLERRDHCEMATSLELCASEMMVKRECAEFQFQFLGNDEIYLRMEWLMKRALEVPGLPESEEAYIARERWGCTCGQCKDGWYSERMRWALKCGATMVAETPELPISAFDSQGFLPLEVAETDVMLNHLPFKQRFKLFIVFYRGYWACLKAVAEFFLQMSDDVFPTCAAIIAGIREGNLLGSMQTQAAICYLSTGGRLEHAVDCIIWHTIQLRFVNMVYQLPVDKMPETSCNNDIEFDLLRRNMCPGFVPRFWGPYTEKSDFVLQIGE
ncbi:hypothetical protein EVG20_g8899 [Dentipellis fragilis]|uniref:Uncharacterized protein n=1 Tax=Dentipellis fragilis TaxID=205917 RepID=A0A4Y9Y4J4_9AGAM|nr:hypothetical protein EVG20_g8899 [Dentipellis fragilis]